jgi:SanA protein
MVYRRPTLDAVWYNATMPALRPAVLLRLLAVGTAVAGIVALPRWLLNRRFARDILPAAAAPPRPVAIVFGAGLRRDGTPTVVLADRVAEAAALYQQGRVETLLLSGSDQGPGRSEPLAMRELALRLGVKPANIWIDTGGVRTYETCLRARDVFDVTGALLVTQRFHLPRALSACRALGIDAVGVAADLHAYSPQSMLFWEFREIAASWVSVWESGFARPLLPARSLTQPVERRQYGT